MIEFLKSVGIFVLVIAFIGLVSFCGVGPSDMIIIRIVVEMALWAIVIYAIRNW